MREPTEPPDPRLYDLFLRYWDNTLTDEESAELNRLLGEDPAVQEEFFAFLSQVVALNECQAVSKTLLPMPEPSSVEPTRGRAQQPRQWSRRHVLGWSGLAMGVAASMVLGLREWVQNDAKKTPQRGAKLASITGSVRLGADGQRAARAGEELSPGEVVSTVGPNSSVALAYPDGSTITLTGETSAKLAQQDHGMFLQRGVASIDVRWQAPGSNLYTLTTAQVTLAGLREVMLTLSQGLAGTEVEVYQGRVTVAANEGQRVTDVQGGYILTVRPDGEHKKIPVPHTPDEFAWDLKQPLPPAWAVGVREARPDGLVLRPELWFDPYHQAEMYQIRSNKQWSRGFFRLYPESVIRLRYRVEKAGPSQMCFCVRSGNAQSSSTGMLEKNSAFANARPGEWQWLEVRGEEMLGSPHVPSFGAPWVGFLVIFNTYELDLGLLVAEFQVTRPGQLD